MTTTPSALTTNTTVRPKAKRRVKTAAVIYGIRELSTDNPARRTFLVNLNWKFNEARSKYRGSGAGEKQKARM